MVSLTGSIEAGRSSPRRVEDLKRVHLELGGKAPVVIFDDVDIESVVEALGFAYYNAGQDCTAATRVLASTSIYDDVVSGVAELAKSLTWVTP